MKVAFLICYLIVIVHCDEVLSQEPLQNMKYVWKIDTLYSYQTQVDSFINISDGNQISIDHINQKYVYFVDFDSLDSNSRSNSCFKIEEIQNIIISRLDDEIYFDSSFVTTYKRSMDGSYELLWKSEYGFSFDPYVLIDGVISENKFEAGIDYYIFYNIYTGNKLIESFSNTEPLNIQENNTYVCLLFGDYNSEILGQLVVFDLLGNQRKYDIIDENNIYEISGYTDINIRDNNILVEIKKKGIYADSFKLIIDLSKEKSAIIVRNETETENASIRILER